MTPYQNRLQPPKVNITERGVSPADTWKKSTPDGGKSSCKGHKAGVCLMAMRSSKETSVARIGEDRGGTAEQARILWPQCRGHCKDIGLDSGDSRKAIHGLKQRSDKI